MPRPDVGPNSVEFTVLQAWRRSSCGGSAGDGYVAVGDFGCPQSIGSGDGNFPPLSGSVVSIDVGADWYLSRHTAIHTYASPNNGGTPWLAGFNSCCRIYAPQVNAPGTNFQLETTVNLAIPDSSPASTIFPIVPMTVNAVNNLVLPLVDNDGDTLTCRLATPAESGISSPPGPPLGGSTSALVVNPNCTITWNTAGTSVGDLWALSVVIEESRGGNPVHGRVMLEFLIQITPTQQGSAPQCDSPPTPTGIVVVPAGVPYAATIQGSDADPGDTLTLNTTGVPAGATMSPGLPTASGSPVSSTFNWTPTLAQAGFHPLLFSVTDQTGNQALCPFTLHVSGCGDDVIQLGEQCDGTADQACPGQCVPVGQPGQCTCPQAECQVDIDCDDSDPCTDDACSSAGGSFVCVHTDNTAPCDDGDLCTQGDVCGQGTCAGTPVVCGPAPQCQTGAGTCDPQTGACTYAHQPDGTLCSDGDPCTIDDGCLAGACTGEPRNCLDDDPCTVDTCDGSGGGFLCEHTDCVTVVGSNCPAQCQPIFCGNGRVDFGESCDPPDPSPDPDHPGQPMCRANCTRCGDARVDTADGESCDDGNLVSGCDPRRPLTPLDACTNQCVGPICRDPGKIRLTDGHDRIDVHGRIEPTIVGTQLDPATSDFVVQLTNPAGDVIFRASLEGGNLIGNAVNTVYKFADKQAPQTGGFGKVKIKKHLNGFRVTARAYGDLAGAGPDMTTHFFIGQQQWVVRALWGQTGYGWRFLSAVQ